MIQLEKEKKFHFVKITGICKVDKYKKKLLYEQKKKRS